MTLVSQRYQSLQLGELSEVFQSGIGHLAVPQGQFRQVREARKASEADARDRRAPKVKISQFGEPS